MPPSAYDRFRQGEASAYARRGDYRRAAATVNDPQLAGSYADLASDAERRRERDETRQYQQGYGQRLAARDYEGAETMAGKFGDLEGVESARDARSADELRERQRGYLALRRYANQFGALADIQDEAQRESAYQALRQRAVQESAQSPELVAEIESMPNDYPTAAAVIPGVLEEWMGRLLSPEDLVRLEMEDRRTRARAENNWDIDDAGRPYRVVDGAVQYGEGRVYRRQPGGGGSRRATYRPLTPEEATAFGLPNNGAGYAMSSDGRPVRVAGGSGASGGMLANAELRGRLILSFPNIVEAQDAMVAAESGARDANDTPLGRDWGARMLESIPFDGGTIARSAGGDDYQTYDVASRTFESSIMPIFSGSAVTESEAQRFVRANLPRFGDNAETLRRKSENRARIVNAAAIMLGEEPPYPDAGFWSPATGLVAPSGGEASPFEGLSDEDLEAIANGGG